MNYVTKTHFAVALLGSIPFAAMILADLPTWSVVLYAMVANAGFVLYGIKDLLWGPGGEEGVQPPRDRAART